MLENLISILIWAQAETKSNQEPFWMNLFLPMGILVLFYFILWRPMQKQEKERKMLLSKIKKNDRVLTSAGIYGTVVAINETEDELTLKVDDSTRIRMTKGCISRNFSNEEEHQAQSNGKVSS
ncbi:MAG: hypothetical protein RL179_54 [Planctomycetota bacterium]|jgi:preprotein translocase subunit YajC